MKSSPPKVRFLKSTLPTLLILVLMLLAPRLRSAPLDCEGLLASVSNPLATPEISWESKTLSHKNIQDFDQAWKIFLDIISNEDEKLEEVRHFLTTLTSEDINVLVLKVQAKVNLFNDHYRWLQEGAIEMMPEQGHILVIGCGTGMNCAALAHHSPHRVIHPLDIQPVMVRHVEEILTTISPSSLGESHLTDIGQALLKEEKYDGIVMISTFPFIPAKERQQVMSVISRALKTGSSLLIQDEQHHYFNDPLTQMSRMVSNLVENHIQISEFEWAFYSAIRSGIFLDFLEPEPFVYSDLRESDVISILHSTAGFQNSPPLSVHVKGHYRIVIRKSSSP